MRRYPTKANPKVYAVIFGIMILAGLALCPMLVYRWRESVRSEAQYKIAPVCASPGQDGCRREIESVVKGTYNSYGRYSTIHYVSLLMRGSALNGDIPVWWESDHSLFGLLKPGDRVTAEEWERQIVAVRGASGGTLRTEYDPTYKHEGFVTALVAVPLVTILISFFEYKLLRSIRRERLKRN
jgi:hypothetical protein